MQRQIEEMVVGLKTWTHGVPDMKNVQPRPSGPDIRHIVIGNEGALCFITEVTLKLYRYRPENDQVPGVPRGHDVDDGMTVIREVVSSTGSVRRCVGVSIPKRTELHRLQRGQVGRL